MMKKNHRIPFVSVWLALLTLCLIGGIAGAASSVDQAQLVTDTSVGNIVIGAPSQQKLAQVVTAGISGRLTEVRAPVTCLYATGLSLEIQEVTGIMPNGVVLTSQSFPRASLQVDPDPPHFTRFVLARPVSFYAGTPFAIVLYANEYDCSIAEGPIGDPYPGGDGYYDARPNPIGEWVPIANGTGRFDLPFQTLVDPVRQDTTISITSESPDPSVVGQPIMVHYVVAPASPELGIPIGNVTVGAGTDSCTSTVAASECSIRFTSPGAKSLTASYEGDAGFNGSTSTGETHQVNKADTATRITADSPDPSVVGQPVTVSYTVTVNGPGSGSPGGNVTVSDGVDECTGSVAAGSCKLTLSTAGTRTLLARYLGDSNFNASTSSGVSHIVTYRLHLPLIRR